MIKEMLGLVTAYGAGRIIGNLVRPVLSTNKIAKAVELVGMAGIAGYVGEKASQNITKQYEQLEESIIFTKETLDEEEA